MSSRIQGGFIAIFDRDFMRWNKFPPLSVSLKKKLFRRKKIDRIKINCIFAASKQQGINRNVLLLQLS